MMKRILPCLLVIVLCVPVCFSSIADVTETADGYLSTGEWYGSNVTLEYAEKLFVTGGGAERISVEDHGYLEVQSTSTPLGYMTGIYDIMLGDDSKLLYLGGITGEITVGNDASAVLKGGTINYLTIYHLSAWESNVTIYCQDGYQMDAAGISGLWANGTSFDIDFINPTGIFAPYPTANYVTVIPEPTTLALLGLGGLFLRRKRGQCQYD